MPPRTRSQRPKRKTEVQRLKKTDASRDKKKKTVVKKPVGVVKNLAWYKNQFEQQQVRERELKETARINERELIIEFAEEKIALNDKLRDAYREHTLSLKQQADILTSNVDAARRIEELKLARQEDRISEDGKKARKLIEKERKQANEYRKKMLKAQADLRKKQERNSNEPKPWRCCEICGQEYTERKESSPRVLHCGHTFCLSCIVQASDGNSGIHCPLDQKYTHTISKVDEVLPMNYALLHM